MTNVRIDVAESVGTITIDRPERFNSLDVETARDLRKAGMQLARDGHVRAVVLRGSGAAFCSGADLKYIRAGGDDADLAYLSGAPRPSAPSGDAGGTTQKYGAIFKQILEYIHSTISEIRRAPKPFIAAVDGIAAAGGFGLAMCCDIVIASERATFEWAYSKTSLTGAESSTFMLPRLVGLRRALELLFLNPRLTAQRALEIGLITAVYPAESFDAEVTALAQRLASGPTEAFGIAKELLNQAAGMDRLDVHLDRELEQLARIADGGNFAEGIDAFFAKRAPAFGVK
ncbi:MAG TPA: enoyl-CoA hydratase-related protein [Thermoanaerobaculia bacterium]|nr:enoyl-CoA hydratase-related protein [Thermoanaerobaculia bacterium]